MNVAAFFTLAAGGVLLGDLSELLRKNLPRYPSVSVARLAHLTVDQAFRDQKLGSVLLWDAAMRATRSEIAV